MSVGIWIYRVSCSEITTLVKNIRVYQSSVYILAVVSTIISGPVATHPADHDAPDTYSMDRIRMMLPIFPMLVSNRTG